jgi:surface protein
MEEKTMSANKQYQPKTRKELKQAIREYQQGKHQERGEPNDWDVSLITDMSNLFFYNKTFNKTFNKPLNKWVTKQVTNMSQMFYGASKFNQPLNGGYKPHCWAFIFTQYCVVNDSTKITGRRLFHKLPVFLVRIVALYAFGDHIGGFDTSQVTNMRHIFNGASSFNQPIGQWKTNQVTDMSCMFQGASSFNQPIEQWETNQVTNMCGMFNSASSFNQPIGQWKTNQVTNMSWMFAGASSFNQPIGQWKTNQVTDMREMFSGASSLKHPKPTTNIIQRL